MSPPRSYTLVVRPSWEGRENNATYTTHREVHSPFLLGDLEPDTEYEFYVEAVNQRGAGPQSSRVIFWVGTGTARERRGKTRC